MLLHFNMKWLRLQGNHFDQKNKATLHNRQGVNVVNNVPVNGKGRSGADVNRPFLLLICFWGSWGNDPGGWGRGVGGGTSRGRGAAVVICLRPGSLFSLFPFFFFFCSPSSSSFFFVLRFECILFRILLRGGWFAITFPRELRASAEPALLTLPQQGNDTNDLFGM